MSRFNLINIINGGRGSGKTTFLKGDPALNIRGAWDVYPDRGMKRLVVDTFDHPSYRDIPVITPEKLQYWKAGTYRMFGSDYKAMLEAIENHVWNACIVFEDSYKYLKSRLDNDTAKFLIDSKQKNIDIFYMYHSWTWIPNDLLRMADTITIMKCNENPEVVKNFLGSFYQKSKEFQEQVNKGEKFGHKSIYIGS